MFQPQKYICHISSSDQLQNSTKIITTNRSVLLHWHLYGYAHIHIDVSVMDRSGDRCSCHQFIPYPCGFQHDLSLITGPNLPQLTNPPDSPRIIGWGTYEEALQGEPQSFSIVITLWQTDSHLRQDMESQHTLKDRLYMADNTFGREIFGVRARLCYGEQSVILIELSGPRVGSYVWVRPITNPRLLFWFKISRDHSKPVQIFRLLATKMHLHSKGDSSCPKKYASKV